MNRYAHRSFSVALACVMVSTHVCLSATSWMFDQQASRPDGLSSDNDVQITIRDTMINPLSRDQVNGLNEEVTVQQRRSIPSIQSHALISFDNWIGDAPGKIAQNASIVNADLYLNLVQQSGSPSVRLYGLSVADANWAENGASANAKAANVAWSQGAFENSLAKDYGSIAAPTATGWFSVDITTALQDYLNGQIAGIVLVSSDTTTVDPANFVFNDRAEGLFIEYTSVPEPTVFLLFAMACAIFLVRRPRLIRVISAACLLSSPLFAELTWVVSGPNQDRIMRVSGNSGRVLSTAVWRDAQIIQQKPLRSLGTASEAAAQQIRPLVGIDGSIVISWDGLFGDFTNQIPAEAVIDGAWLWASVLQTSAQFAWRVRGLAQKDSNWQENGVCAVTKDTSTTWSQGSFANSLGTDYGYRTVPSATGLMSIAGDIGPALVDIQRGRCGGIVFDPIQEGSSKDIQACFIATKEAENYLDRPALLIAWHLPGASVSPAVDCPDVVRTHGDVLDLRLTMPDAETVYVDGKRATRTAGGVWQLESLADGKQHEIFAENYFGQTRRLVVLEKKELKISSIQQKDTDVKRKIRLAWEGISNLHYVVESCSGLTGQWTSIQDLNGVDGEMALDIDVGEGSRFYRIRAP